MNQYLSDFETWAQNEDKGRKTITTYRSVMTKFIQWYEVTTGTEFRPADVTPVLLQDFRSHMQTVEHAKPSTINKDLSILKVFFTWALDAGHTRINPAAKIKMIRTQQSHAPKWMDDNQVHRLLYAVEGQRNDWKRLRDLAIVHVMLDAGLRVEETSELKISHINMKSEIVEVMRGKRNKHRSVPMTRELKRVLRAWINVRSDNAKPAHQTSDYLFVSERAGHMTVRGINHMLDGHLALAGLLDRATDGRKENSFSCHSLRHTFCKNLVNNGWSIQNVARVAGHESIQTTMRYVEPSQDELKKAMQAIR